jgi:hypothetical protein
MRTLLLPVLLAATTASVAIAQETMPLIAGDKAASAELSKIIEGVRASGLPVEPIVAKINYGILMKAPALRIVAAARGTAARLEEARDALAPHPTESDIAAGENALSSNVSVKSIKEIRRVASNRPVAVPLGLLSQLVVSGVQEPKAAKMVTDLIRHGASVEQLANLGNDFNSDVQQGAKANNAFDLRLNHLNAVLGVPTITTTTTAGDFAASVPPPGGKKKP